MNANEREYLDALVHDVIGACFEVSNLLGGGFLEKVYERALVKELRLRGITAEPQVQLQVAYKGEVVGDYFCDILVEGKLIIELKCCDAFRQGAPCANTQLSARHRLFDRADGEFPKTQDGVAACRQQILTFAFIRVHTG